MAKKDRILWLIGNSKKFIGNIRKTKTKRTNKPRALNPPIRAKRGKVRKNQGGMPKVTAVAQFPGPG